jgi:hypothetical protein
LKRKNVLRLVISLAALCALAAAFRACLGFDHIAQTLDAGNGREIRIWIDEFIAEGSIPVCYEVVDNDQVVVAKSLIMCKGFDERVHFSLVKSPDGQLVAVVEDKEPLEFLAITDFTTGESWPGGPDNMSWDEEYRKRARLFDRLQSARPDLEIIKGHQLFRTVDLESGRRLLIWTQDRQGTVQWQYEIVDNEREVVPKTFFGSPLVRDEEPFAALKSPNAEMVALYTTEKPEEIVVLCDLSDGTSWPCVMSSQNELNRRQGQLLLKLEALCPEHRLRIPRLRIAKFKVEGLLEVDLCLMYSSKAAPGQPVIRLSSSVSFDDIDAVLRSGLLKTTGPLCTFPLVFDPARKDVLDFTALLSEDRKVIAVVHVSDPGTVLAMHDFRTGTSWPGTMSVEERDTLFRSIRNRPSGDQ